MALEAEGEYSALREEVLMRFNRIFDLAKVGPTGVLAALAFQQSSSAIDPIAMLILVQFFLVTMALIGINEFRHIYRIGTYISLFCEGVGTPGWTRMSRSFGQFLESPAYVLNGGDPSVLEHNKRLFPFGERWGEDPTVYAIVILVLAVASWSSTALSIFENTIPISFWPIVLSVVLTICLCCLLWSLRWGIGPYRKRSEQAWRIFSKSWRNDFSDPYI